MKSDLTIQETVPNVEAAKVDLVLGLKQREAFHCKIKLDEAISEMADSGVGLDDLSHKTRETSENSSRMLALLLEGDFAEQKKRKSNEVEQAKKIKELVDSLNRLQSSNNEKDGLILTLKTNMAKLEAESTRKSEEISRLSREVKSLSKTRSNPVTTPVPRRCSAKSRLGDKRKGMDERSITPKKGSNPSQISEKGCRSTKRKAVGAVAASEQGRSSRGQLAPPEFL